MFYEIFIYCNLIIIDQGRFEIIFNYDYHKTKKRLIMFLDLMFGRQT